MNRIQDFWLNQTGAEYNSSARTIHLVHWMQQVAMSPDLIREAISIADDEMVHAQLCYAVAAEAGCTSGLPYDDLSLSLGERFDDPRKNVLYVLVESYCFGETVAVPLFSAMRVSTHSTPQLWRYTIRYWKMSPGMPPSAGWHWPGVTKCGPKHGPGLPRLFPTHYPVCEPPIMSPVNTNRHYPDRRKRGE